MKILTNLIEPKLFKFDSASSTPEDLYVGRKISEVKSDNFLIKKLSERIKTASKDEVNFLNNHYSVALIKGTPYLICDDTDKEVPVYNLGTYELPAFYWNGYVFVFDGTKKAFVSKELSAVFFNKKYLLTTIGDLVIVFDVKGLKGLGVFVSATKVPRGYIIVTRTNDGEAVFAAHKNIQQLFLADLLSACNVNSESGTVTHQYIDMSTIPAGQVVDTYKTTAKGYVLADHYVE